MKKEQSPAYLWYPKDALSSGKIASLTDLEELWYRRALDHCWLDDGLPADPAEFAAWVGRGCTPESAKKIIERFFIPHKKCPERVVNNRQEKERKKLAEKFRQKSEAGRRGMASRWKQDTSHYNSVITDDNIPIPISIPKKEEEKEEANASDSSRFSETENAIYEFWKNTFKKNEKTTRFTPERRKKVRARLKDGYTLERIQNAIRGCALRSFNNGQNSDGVKYNDLELICRNATKLEGYEQTYLDSLRTQPVNESAFGVDYEQIALEGRRAAIAAHNQGAKWLQ